MIDQDPQEFKFKVVQTGIGMKVIWKDILMIPSGDYHVIEYKAYTDLRKENDILKENVEKLQHELKMAVAKGVMERHSGLLKKLADTD